MADGEGDGVFGGRAPCCILLVTLSGRSRMVHARDWRVGFGGR